MNLTRKHNVRSSLDWFFKDFQGRRGGYIITESPNKPLIAFMILIVIAVVSYPGFWQTSFSLAAYASLTWWGFLEVSSGRSRFRKFLGIGAIIAVIGALIMRLGF